jgi:hypothetical protein
VKGPYPQYVAAFGINREYLSGVPVGDHISNDVVAGLVGSRRGPDNGNSAGFKKPFQIFHE